MLNVENTFKEFVTRWVRILRIMLVFGLAAYEVAMIVYLVLRLIFADRFWWLATINTFVLLTFLPVPIILLLALLLRKRLLTLAALVLVCIGLVWFGRYYLPKAQVSASGKTLHIISFNVMGDNRRFQDAVAWLRQQNPDIVFMQEYPDETELSALKDLYPYQYVQQQIWGNLVLSKYPFQTTEDIDIPKRQASGIQRITLDLNGQTIAIYDVHLQSPFRDEPRYWLSYYQSESLSAVFSYDDTVRNFEMQNLLGRVEKEPLPYLVAGDFNTSDQSGAYMTLAAQMTDTFREIGIGLGTSWPVNTAADLPKFIPPLIRIDYIWHSSAFQPLEVHQGPSNLGSDHVPLVATFALRQAP